MSTSLERQKRRLLKRAAPPAGYVPGLGRGATGFMTRSDIGPARDVGTSGAAAAKPKEQDYSDANFDDFSGYSNDKLFADTPYEADDREADVIYDSVDQYMDGRRKRTKMAQEKPSAAASVALASTTAVKTGGPPGAKESVHVRETFKDLKRQLGSLSESDWDAIPEIGDRSLRFKKQEERSFMPAPDMLLEKARQEVEMSKSIDTASSSGGRSSSGTASSVVGDLSSIGEGKGTVLGLKLDTVSDSVSGQTNVNAKGYLTDLNSLKITSDAEVGDIKKARALLTSVVQTNPKHAPGWIAAARLEEMAGKLAAARKLAEKGCKHCPGSEDVWLEWARLESTENAKGIIARAIAAVPHSVKVWLHAAAIESDVSAKRRVLRRALERVPNSVKLWRAAIELEDANDARIMLSRAVECVPRSVEMWLALARLESYDNAKKVLNKARETLPGNLEIWLTAAKLEEANGKADTIGIIVDRAIKSLTAQHVSIEREDWLREAETAEREEYTLVCQAIVRASAMIGVEEPDRKKTWTDDADVALEHGAVETARALLSLALTAFPGKKSVWLRAAQLERKHGTSAQLQELLAKAVKYCPKEEVLWLMAAKDKWTSGDVAGARTVLQDAFAANSDSEEIWVAAVKLEFEEGEIEHARALLVRARERADTPRIWMKSVHLEREVGNPEMALSLVQEAVQKYPDFEKLWMQYAQVAKDLAKIEMARKALFDGVKRNAKSVAMWLALARLEADAQNATKARSVLEMARSKNPTSDLLWRESYRVELKFGGAKAADAVMARALQKCPNSPVLWAEAVVTAPRPQQKTKSVDALKRCENDPRVVIAVAQLFWSERKLDKARRWLERAVALDADNGDSWAALLRFEHAHGDEAKVAGVEERCAKAEPRHGELWAPERKAVGAAKLSTVEILRRTAAKIDAR